MFSFEEMYDEVCGIDWVLESLDDSKKFYIKGLSDNVCERNRIYHDAIGNTDKIIEMIYKYNPGIDAISSILCAIDSWNSLDINLIEAYSRKRKVLGNALSASVHGIHDMYNRDTFYIESVYKVVKDTVDGLSISLITDGIDDDSFEYSVNNLISELGKLDLQEPVDINKVRYISEIYLMIFVLLEYYKTHEVDINDYDE